MAAVVALGVARVALATASKIVRIIAYRGTVITDAACMREAATFPLMSVGSRPQQTSHFAGASDI